MNQILSKLPNRGMIALIVTAMVSTIAIAIYGSSQLKPSRQPPETVLRQAPQIAALGRLEPVSEVIRVSAPATLSNDRIAQLLVRRGDQIQANQIIAVLGSRDRLQSALLEAQERVRVAQAELAKVRAGAKAGEIAAQAAEIARLQKELQGEIASQQAVIARWQSEVNTATGDYNRYRSLYREGATAASQLDQKYLVLTTAQAQLNEAKANQNKSIDTVREQIKQAQATLNQISEVRPVEVRSAQAEVDRAIAAVKQAEANLADVYVRAPVAGRIFEIHAKPGETVTTSGIAELGQTDQMQVVAEVYQTDIDKVRVGQRAVITGESFTGKVQGTVRLVGLQVTQQEVASGEPGENLDRRIVEVRILLNANQSQRVAHLTNSQVQVAIKL